ncbi:hypothetical protein HGRIS_003326 [Hohenbuehelia grisea]|uniref:Uncharacterized protein n=1 Tax=Hohenbuehelia grisea TaxID=104357 RepID=A0ABR3JFZ2_9AGAR
MAAPMESMMAAWNVAKPSQVLQLNCLGRVPKKPSASKRKRKPSTQDNGGAGPGPDISPGPAILSELKDRPSTCKKPRSVSGSNENSEHSSGLNPEGSCLPSPPRTKSPTPSSSQDPIRARSSSDARPESARPELQGTISPGYHLHLHRSIHTIRTSVHGPFPFRILFHRHAHDHILTCFPAHVVLVPIHAHVVPIPAPVPAVHILAPSPARSVDNHFLTLGPFLDHIRASVPAVLIHVRAIVLVHTRAAIPAVLIHVCEIVLVHIRASAHVHVGAQLRVLVGALIPVRLPAPALALALPHVRAQGSSTNYDLPKDVD